MCFPTFYKFYNPLSFYHLYLRGVYNVNYDKMPHSILNSFVKVFTKDNSVSFLFNGWKY